MLSGFDFQLTRVRVLFCRSRQAGMLLSSSTRMAPEDLVSVAEPVPNVRDPLAPLIPARALAIAVKQREECDWNNWILIG